MSYRLSVETVSTYAHSPDKGTACTAAVERYSRLRGQGIKAELLTGVTSAQIKFTDPMTGDHHTLTYTDTENQA
jgi:hypothetical protein